MLTSPPLDDFPTIPGPPPRLGVLASGSGSNFEVIARSAADGELNAEVVELVCNNPGARCLQRAGRLEVPSTVVDHRDFTERTDFDRRVLQVLADRAVDWVIMAGWMRIVTDVFIDAYPGRILNLHPSLLPSFPGAHAVEDALAAGVTITGCTVHVVTEALDDGPIVAQSAVPVYPEDDPDTLHERIHEAEHFLFPRAIAHQIARTR